MNRHKNLLRGSKFSDSHTTIIECARPLIAKIKPRAEVSKIVIGIIVPTGRGRLRVKATQVPAGLKLQVQGQTANQTFFVYTDDPPATAQFIDGTWSELHR